MVASHSQQPWNVTHSLRILASRALLAVVLGFITYFVYVNWSDVQEMATLRGEWIAVAFVCGLISLLIHAVGLQIMLNGQGVSTSYSKTVGLLYLPMLGKYIPGKIWTITAGLYLYVKEGIPQSIAGTSMVMMMALDIATGAMIASVFSGAATHVLGGVWPVIALLALMLVGISPAVFFPMMNLALRCLKRAPITSTLRIRHLMGTLIVTAISWIPYGGGLICLVRSCTDVPSHTAAYIIGLFAFAQIAGFLAFFAPAGIGVREGVLISGLTPVVGPGPAIIISGACRIWQTALELLMAAIGWWALKSNQQHRLGDHHASTLSSSLEQKL